MILAILASLQAPADSLPIVRVVGPNHYQATGRNPSWLLMITEREIGLRIVPSGAVSPADYVDTRFPRTEPDVDGNVTLWRSNEGGRAISVEARQTPTRCELRGRRYEDYVRVTIGARMLNGCGGRMIPEGQR
ncbi:hypothetical protein [Sphingosinicella sp.]|uniref:hypothetical protein n=1 Tax=Sphingosinicella sp. TaxID=1917971 RepID=UPI004037D055